MKRLLSCVLVVVVAQTACVPMQEETRTERGSLLRSYRREVQLGNKTLQGVVVPRWPELELKFARYDTCRTEQVEEYAEQRITERSSRGVGPAIALGISATIAGAVLLGGRNAFSAGPNTGVIDAGGRYGPSPRQLATAYGTGALIVGLPALAVGLIDYARSGERIEATKGETVVSARDALCRPAPVDGTIDFLGGAAPRALQTTDGALLLKPEQARELGDFTVNLNSEPVFFTPAEDAKLNAYLLCLQVLPAPSADDLTGLSRGLIRTRLELLDACDDIAPEPAAEARRAYEEALSAASKRDRPTSSLMGPRPQTYEEVAQLYRPERRVAEGTSDALALSRGEFKTGEPLSLIGTVRGRSTVRAAVVVENGTSVLVPLPDGAPAGDNARELQLEVANVQVGELSVVVLLEPGSLWDSAVRGGARLEFIGVVRAAKDTEGNAIPFVEAVWARTSAD